MKGGKHEKNKKTDTICTGNICYKNKSRSWILLLLICIATCFMSMGYAAIDSIKSEISGTLLVQAQDGIFITDVVYVDDVNAELANSEIKQFYQAMLESSVTLSDTDINSSITYTITIYNSTAQDYYFAETKYVDDFYDNANIKFELVGLDTGGGAISQISTEYESVDTGVVMYVLPEGTEEVDWTGDSNSNGIKDVQEDYDQFVWIPVKNAILDLSSNSDALASDDTIKLAVQSEINAGRYPMAIKSTDGNYIGVLYQFALSSSTVNVSPLAGWSPKVESNTGYREPDSITDDDEDATNLAQINGILNNVSLSDANSFKARLQQQYNTMVGEVDTNGGFWVGRYETSGLTDYTDETQNQIKVQTKRGKTEGLHTATWYRMYAEQELYSSKLGISFESSMIWGSQYDPIMIWMKDFDNTSQDSKFIVNSIGMANLGEFSGVNDGWTGSGPAPTGYLDTYNTNNIYDISGNVYEWEIGAYSNNARSKRGGYFDVAEWLSDYARADARHYTRSNYSGNVNGTRMAIY